MHFHAYSCFTFPQTYVYILIELDQEFFSRPNPHPRKGMGAQCVQTLNTQKTLQENFFEIFL